MASAYRKNIYIIHTLYCKSSCCKLCCCLFGFFYFVASYSWISTGDPSNLCSSSRYCEQWAPPQKQSVLLAISDVGSAISMIVVETLELVLCVEKPSPGKHRLQKTEMFCVVARLHSFESFDSFGLIRLIHFIDLIRSDSFA